MRRECELSVCPLVGVDAGFHCCSKLHCFGLPTLLNWTLSSKCTVVMPNIQWTCCMCAFCFWAQSVQVHFSDNCIGCCCHFALCTIALCLSVPSCWYPWTTDFIWSQCQKRTGVTALCVCVRTFRLFVFLMREEESHKVSERKEEEFGRFEVW